MIYVHVIGVQEFLRDGEKTLGAMPHYLMSALNDMGETIETLAKRLAPGKLNLSVGRDRVLPHGGNFYQGQVGVKREPRHALFVHEGTGVYGPSKKPYTIRKTPQHPGPPWGLDRTGRPNPAVGNVLKIQAQNGRGFMIDGKAFYFRPEVTVMGQRPQPYLTEAFEAAKRSEIPFRVQRLAHQIVR